MFTIVSTSGQAEYGIRQFAVDNAGDLAAIDVSNCKMGSTARIINTGELYMLNGEKQWKLQSGAGGGGGDTPSPDNTYYWDGGELTR